MSRPSLIAAVALLAVSGHAWAQKSPSAAAKPNRRRGFAAVEVTRPASFPHRVWAFCGFEAKLPSYGWFGKTETANIPAYPGNSAAQRATGPYQNHSALMTGCDPVPGPRMGASNYMYCRYYITGGDAARFQHYSLSRNDNNHINVTGLTRGKWSELTLNFTRDARRNDGSKEAFRKGERMDDLKVYVGKPNDGNKWQFVLDDMIFFSNDPRRPGEKEPFPQRVLFLAGFDTGIDAASKDKFYPGRWQAAMGKDAPAGSYWAVAKGVATEDGKGAEVLLKMTPPRPAGKKVKVRFRYWLKGADRVDVTLTGADPHLRRKVSVQVAKQGAWATKYLDVSLPEKAKAPTTTALGELKFSATGKDAPVRLYVDEVVLFQPGKPVKSDKPLP